MIIDKEKAKHRAAGLDLFRVVAAVMVLLFHCNIHHDSSFGPLTGFISMGAVCMTAFFMLSGYVLFLTYKDKSLVQAPALKNFYLKRVLGIFPLYLVVAMLYVVTLGQESSFQNLVLLPIEVLGLQSVFSTLFPVSHNGGTWFISCLLFVLRFCSGHRLWCIRSRRTRFIRTRFSAGWNFSSVCFCALCR